jgi:hypothetical protein
MQRLEAILDGYSYALEAHGVAEHGVRFNQAFADYLWQTRGWTRAQGAFYAVWRACNENDEEAWERYWRLIWEYRDSIKNPEPPPVTS